MTTDSDRTAATGPPASEPLPGLAPGGRFSARLDRSAPASVKTDFGSTWNRVDVEFSAFRRKYDQVKATGGTPEEMLRAVLKGLSTLKGAAAVLAYCLAAEHRLTALAAELQGAAWEAFQEDLGQYDLILGDLMPAEFRKQGRQLRAHRNYLSGASPTADRDWAAFLDSLEVSPPDATGRIETGLTPLDDALLNGLDGLTVLGGPTGSGKSTLALNLVAGALRRHPKLAVLYVLLDPGMTRERMYRRLTCTAAGIDYRALIHKPAPEVLQKVRAASESLRTDVLSRLRVVEVPAARPEPFDQDVILDKRWALMKATGAEQALIVVDDLEHLDVPEDLRKSQASLEADFARIAAIQEARSRTRTSHPPAGTPTLLLSGITKAWDGRSSLTADFLPGSVRLKQACDTVLMLQPGDSPADPTAPAPVILRIVKGRDGARRVDLPLLFDHTRSTFRPAASRSATKRGAAVGAAPALDPLTGVGEG